MIQKLNNEILSDDQKQLKSIHDDLVDDILYLQDIFSLNLEEISFVLINSLFYYTILPLLCGSLTSMIKPKIAISVSLYTITALVHYIKDESFLNILFLFLFKKEISLDLNQYIENFPFNPKNYYFDWNQQKKSNYLNFVNFISLNFSEPFIKSIVYQTNSCFPEINLIVKKYEKISEDLSNPKFFEILLADILGKFSNSDLDVMTGYHKNISVATGINVGLSTQDNSKMCTMKLIDNLLVSNNVF